MSLIGNGKLFRSENQGLEISGGIWRESLSGFGLFELLTISII